MLCLASCVEVVFAERGVVYSQVVFAQILSGGSLREKSYVDDLVEILLCEGGDIELGVLEPRNISLCLRLIHYLYLSLIYLALHHIHILLLGIVCVLYLC